MSLMLPCLIWTSSIRRSTLISTRLMCTLPLIKYTFPSSSCPNCVTNELSWCFASAFYTFYIALHADVGHPVSISEDLV